MRLKGDFWGIHFPHLDVFVRYFLCLHAELYNLFHCVTWLRQYDVERVGILLAGRHESRKTEIL